MEYHALVEGPFDCSGLNFFFSVSSFTISTEPMDFLWILLQEKVINELQCLFLVILCQVENMAFGNHIIMCK